MALTGAQITQAQIGVLSAASQTDADLVASQVSLKSYRYTTQIDYPSTSAVEYGIASVPLSQTGGMVITKVSVLPSAALTANAGNYATISLEKNDGAGGTKTKVATANTTPSASTAGTGDWTAYSGVNIPVTSASAVVAAGSMLIFRIEKGGTGVDVPPGTTFIVDGYPL